MQRRDRTASLGQGLAGKLPSFLLGSANSGFLVLHMSIMTGQALNDLENRFLTKTCLLNSSVVWVPCFASPHYSFPVEDSRDPKILGLQLKDCINIMHIPNSPSVVTKPESKLFVDRNENLHSCHTCLHSYLYMCPYICIHLYELTYENIF